MPAALNYNSDTVAVQPIVQAAIPTEVGDPLPSTIDAKLTWNGVTQAAQTFTVPPTATSGDILNIAAQVANPVTQSGRYAWQLNLTMKYGGGLATVTRTLSGSSFVVASDPPLGNGWSLSIVDQLIPIAADANGPAGVLRVYGPGESRFYASTGNGTFQSPPGDNGTLVQNGDGSYAYTDPAGNVRDFNSAGLQTAWTSTDAFTKWGFTYGPAGGPTDAIATVTAPDNAVTTFNYQNGLATSIAVASGSGGPVMRTYGLSYSSGNLVGATNPDGSQYTFGYDAAKHLTSEDLGGETGTFTYQNGEAATLQQGSGAPGSLAPANLQGINGIVTGSQPAVYTDPNGHTTTTVLDSQGRPLQQTDALGNVTTWVRDANGYVTSMTDPNGNTTNYEVDAQGYVLQTSYPDGSTEQFRYNDPNHNLTSYTDQNGHTTSYTYDSDGHNLTLRDPLGNTTSYTWANGLMATMTDPNGGVTQYFHDANRRLIETIDPLGFTSKTSYDANGFVASTTDANGNTTTFVNDPMGRVLQMTTALGFLTKSTYDANGNVLTRTDPNGNTTQYVYSDRGLLVTTTDPLGNVTTDSYDPADNLVAATDRNGHTTQFVYDADNRQTETISPLGFVTQTSYDPDGKVTATIDANGNTTQYVFNSLNRQTETIDPLGNLSKTGYDAGGSIINVTNANGTTTTFQLDADNRQVASTDPLGNTSTSQYDSNSNVIASTDANGHTTHFSYDADNRQTSVTDPLGFVSTTTYDPAGNVIATTDANGNTTHFSYDADNRQTAVTNALGNTTLTAFDPVGNVISVTDPLGNKTTYTFDADNRQIVMTDPLGHSEYMTYDAVSNLLSTTDRDGRITKNTFDADNRLIQTVWIAADGHTVTDTKTYQYDANGNLLAASNNAGTYTMTYDGDNRLATQTDPLGLTLTYGYDGNGNTISVRDSLGGLTTSVYDGDNRLASRRFTDGTTQLRIDFTYDGNGNMLSQTRYSDLAGTQKVGSTQSTYDADNRQVSIVHYDGSGNVLASYSYTYDAGSRVTSQTINGVTTTYAYDAINELTRDGTNVYSYDVNYNRTNPGYVTGANNELQTDGTWNYSYDNEGNLVQKVGIANGQTWTYTYNNANLVISAVAVNRNGHQLSQSDYTLDVFGNRISQTIFHGSGHGNPQVTHFAYDNAQGAVPNIWADLDASGSLTTRRIFGDGFDQPLARIDSNGIAWYLTDHLGSIMAVLSNAGLLIDKLTYDAFGNVQSETNPSAGDRYKFAGMQLDIDGQYTTPDRRVDPRTGRWSQQDLMRASGTNPNLYPYAANDPTNATDPTGRNIYFVNCGEKANACDCTGPFHQDVGVDTWEKNTKGEYEYKGPLFYYLKGFFPNPVQGLFITFGPLGLIGGEIYFRKVYGESTFSAGWGIVVADDNLEKRRESGCIQETIITTPEEDIRFKEEIQKMYPKKLTGYGPRTCRTTADEMWKKAKEMFPNKKIAKGYVEPIGGPSGGGGDF